MFGENKKLSVIILFFHGERWIESCIQSLQHQSLRRQDYELILVDNGGSTPSVDNYNGQPHVKVLRFSKNYGFAGGNNRALTHAEGQLILLMNQDVIVHFQCLEEFIAAFEDNPQAGLISANMKMISNRNEVDPHCPLGNSVGLYRLSRLGYAYYSTKDTRERLVAVNFVSGNALCFRKNLPVEIGNYLFDERLGSYAEDLDVSIRLNKAGGKMYVCPRAIIFHFRHEAFSGNPSHQLWKLFYISSNRLLVYYNNLPIFHFLLKLPALLLGIPSKVIRHDGARKLHIFHFLAALGCLPFIFSYFLIRAFQTSKIDIR